MSALAGRLAHLANRIEARLANEHADRQTIAEDAVAELRELARMDTGTVMNAELGARHTAATAALAGFRADERQNDHPTDYFTWSRRLALELGGLLGAFGQADTQHPASPGASGPYETEQQVDELPAVRAIYDAAYVSNRRGAMDEGNVRLLDDTLHAAGVDLGAYDARILAWLCTWEPQTIAVIAGWVTRAHTSLVDRLRVGLAAQEARGALLEPFATLGPAEAATAVDALEVAAEYRRYRASLTCEACAVHPAELCEDHAADLDRAGEYDRLAQQIREATR